MRGNTAYRAIEPFKITAREIPSPRQPYLCEYDWQESLKIYTDMFYVMPVI